MKRTALFRVAGFEFLICVSGCMKDSVVVATREVAVYPACPIIIPRDIPFSSLKAGQRVVLIREFPDKNGLYYEVKLDDGRKGCISSGAAEIKKPNE